MNTYAMHNSNLHSKKTGLYCNVGRLKHGTQILVVDDEPALSGVMKLLLEHDGHQVQIAASGPEALALLGQREFGVVITDFSMPGMKGDELVAHIKELIPEQPVIMVTAFAAEFATFAKPSGIVDAVLPKPFSFEDLRDTIDAVLSQASAERAANASQLPFLSATPPPPDATPPKEIDDKGM